MGGWDKDETGDYVPRPPPLWFWGLIGLIVAGVMVLAVVFSS